MKKLSNFHIAYYLSILHSWHIYCSFIFHMYYLYLGILKRYSWIRSTMKKLELYFKWAKPVHMFYSLIQQVPNFRRDVCENNAHIKHKSYTNTKPDFSFKIINSMFLKGKHKTRKEVVPVVSKFLNLDFLYICPPQSHSGPSWCSQFCKGHQYYG